MRTHSWGKMEGQPQGSDGVNPFQPGTASSPASPSAQSVSAPQMLEILGSMLQQTQEQNKVFMTAVQAMSVEQERQSSNLKHAVDSLQDRGSSGANFSKLLQRPDVFRPKDREEELTLWYEWAWTFKQWMLAVSPEIHGHLIEIEKDLSSEIDELSVSDDAMALSNKLYAVLTTMLRERPLQILRSVPDNNGFEAWRVLHTTLAPKSKTRALALLGAISQYPNMTQGNLLE